MLPAVLELLAARPAQRAACDRRLVLGRQPATDLRAVAGADGAAARARGQCRRRHHGAELQRDLRDLAGGPARGGRLCQRRRQCAGPRDRGGSSAAPRCGRSCRADAPKPNSAACRSRFSGFPMPPPIATTGRSWNRPIAPGAGCAWRCRLRQRTIVTPPEPRARRPRRDPGARRHLDGGRRRHLCRLRQSQGTDRRQCRSPDRPLSRDPANPDGAARRPG